MVALECSSETALRQKSQMYEAEDLKSRLQQSSAAETGRRKRPNRHGPYETTTTRTTTTVSATTATISITNSTKPSCLRSKDKTYDEVTSSSDHRIKRTMMTQSEQSSRLPKSTKQPTLVELLQAGVERPPFGPPRLSAQHTASVQRQSTLPADTIAPRSENPTTNRSCILQLLQCPPIEDRRPQADPTLMTSTTGPLIVEADSSNLPLDEDLLMEMRMSASSSSPRQNCDICPVCQAPSQDLTLHLKTACAMMSR